MADQVSYRITILGRQLQVRSSSPPETVRAIETLVNERLTEVAASVPSGDTQTVAFLALLNIAESYLRAIHEQELVSRQYDERLAQLLARLDSAETMTSTDLPSEI